MTRQRSSGKFRAFLFLVLVVLLVFAGLAAFRAGGGAEIAIRPALAGIGKRTPVTVHVSEPGRGLADVRVELVQGERVETLASEAYVPAAAWKPWATGTEETTLQVDVGRDTVKDLAEGEATIRVVAERAPALLRRPDPAVAELTLPVILRPPALHVLSDRTYVKQGGSEAVVYQVGPTAVRSGVRAGERWFPGHPLPGGADNQRFALFSAPYDQSEASAIALVAEDTVGNASRVEFIDRFTPRPPRHDTIVVDDPFMERVVPAILSQTPDIEDRGNLLENYLMINGELRAQNDETLRELADASAREFLWDEPFLPMRNAAVMSNFADRRTYLYGGREVDRQDHLGFDLASTSRAEIQAANDGIVKLARFFGIYGNTVVIDHGYGLMTLYGHLSTIAVEEGERVERGQTIGRSGQTGLAGGDHLHFTVLLGGLPVDPQEWWDAHWIHDRLKLKLADAMPFEG